MLPNAWGCYPGALLVRGISTRRLQLSNLLIVPKRVKGHVDEPLIGIERTEDRERMDNCEFS